MDRLGPYCYFPQLDIYFFPSKAPNSLSPCFIKVSLLTISCLGKTPRRVKTSNRSVEPEQTYWDANQRMIDLPDMIVSQPTKEMSFLVMWMITCNIGVFKNSFWWVIPPSRVIEETITIKWTEPVAALPYQGCLLYWQLKGHLQHFNWSLGDKVTILYVLKESQI